MVKNANAWISKDNGLLTKSTYYFGPDGRMDWKEGIVSDADDEVRFYKDNIPAIVGLVKDTDGSYYYINSSKKAVRNTWYGISEGAANGLMPGGIYFFEEDGRMQLKEGIYREKNGDLSYYENGKAIAKGLVQDENGDYFYFGSTKKAIKNRLKIV